MNAYEPLTGATRQVPFPSCQDYLAARVFPLVEKSSWVGAGFVFLAFGRDWAQTQGAEPWWTLVLVHALVLVFSAGAALAARFMPGTKPRLVAILVLGSLSQVSLVGASLFVLPSVRELPSLLTFFFLSFLFLGPLVSRSWMWGFFVFVTVQVGSLLVLARQTGQPGVDDQAIVFVMGFLVPSLVFIGLLLELSRAQARETYRLAQADHLSLTLDALSSLLNRSSWLGRAEARWRRCLAAGRTASVAMVDIDHFKQINDSLGHDAGDQVIRAVSGVLLDQTRESDLVGRVGGEEFAVFLPETDRTMATEVAQRIRRAVETLSLPMGRGVTVSIGVVEAREGVADLASLVTEADRRLYLAKGSGRNRVVDSPSMPR